MICPNCKTCFEPKAVNQLYCSPECGEKYRRKNPTAIRFPTISFNCAHCGKAVVTDGKRDQRTRFCCQACEKKYWRHPPHEHSALTTYNAKLREWYEKNIE